jgi:AcrR family transcriptional regulator
VKQEKQDRRSQRTRHLISSAMMELLLEQRYDAITVQELLVRAGIGRSTFYAHYFDKEDVLWSIAEQMLETYRQQLSQGIAGQRIVPSLALFRHVADPHGLRYQAMVRGHAGEKFWEIGQELLSRNIEQALTATCAEGCPPTIPLAVVSQYLAGAFLNLLKWWLEAGMPYSAEQMDSMFQQLALPGVWATLGTKSEEAEEQA